jgi:uncharacterized protein YdaU (DUF1376 family)
VAKAPAFQFYARDWLTDEAVKLLSLAGQGLYVRLLCHQWLEGSIPSTHAVVALATGCNTRTVKANWDMVERFFPLSSDRERRANPRLAEQRKSLADMKERQSEGGKKGAKERWDTHKATQKDTHIGNPMASDGSAVAVATATATVTTSPPTPSSDEGGEEPVEHIGNEINNLWRSLGLKTPRVYDWIMGAVAISTLTEHFTETEILTAVNKIGATPDLAWAGKLGPAYLTKHTGSGQLVLEAVLNWRDNSNGQQTIAEKVEEAVTGPSNIDRTWENAE